MVRVLITLVLSLTVSASAWAGNWNSSSSSQKKPNFENEKQPNCEPFTGSNGVTVGIIGDSQFTGQFGLGCGSIDYFLSHSLESGSVVNVAQSGGKFLKGGKKDITKQRLPFNPDILIIGGGGNDLAACNGKASCRQKVVDKLVDKTGEGGVVVETINRLSSPTTTVIITQTSKVADFAPTRWKETAQSKEAQEYVNRLKQFANTNPQIHLFDYSEILDRTSKSDWLKDGFHPSMIAYFKMSEAIKAKLNEGIDNFADARSLQDVGGVRETCSYVAVREGINEKDKFYRYDYGAGKIQFLDMKHGSDLRVKFMPKEGINDIYTIETDSFLTIDTFGHMKGWLGVYGGKKSKKTNPKFTTAEYSFEDDGKPYEGTHIFTNRDWIRKWYQKITVFDCGSNTSQSLSDEITPQTLRNEWFQVDAIDVDGLKEVSSAKPIKLKLRLGIPNGDGPFPTVVILHGSGNMKERDHALGTRLKQNGLAWVGVYSYDSRGLKYKPYDERLIGSNVFDQVSDAFHALKFIKNHPLLDSGKVAVTGFSLGGLSSYAIASTSLSEKFNVSSEQFVYGLNQYGPCLMFPTDPNPKLKIEHLWGNKDSSTPKKLCKKLNEHINNKGGSSQYQFIEGAAHGWFKQGPPTLDADSNFQCEVEVDAEGVRLSKGGKKPEDLSDLALLKFAAKHCRKRTPVEAYAYEPAEDLTVKSLVNALQ